MVNQKGTVIQVMGPVLDIRFSDSNLPQLLNAIEIPNGNSSFHVGDSLVVVTTDRGSIQQLNDIFA